MRQILIKGVKIYKNVSRRDDNYEIVYSQKLMLRTETAIHMNLKPWSCTQQPLVYMNLP